MNLVVAILLGQDGLTNGAIYALLALAILLVFSVTRILLIPQGEFVSFSALTMAAMQAGKPVQLGWLLLAFCATAILMDLYTGLRDNGRWLIKPTMICISIYALALTLVTFFLPLANAGAAIQAALTAGLLIAFGPLFYRVVFQPLASAHSLVLLIVSIASHVALVGIGLLMFGPEGMRTEPFTDISLNIGPAMINGQSVAVVVLSLALIGMLYAFFEKTLYGKALRATAVDRLGSQLVGISPALAGQASFTLAALIGALSGILIAPLTTIYYDSGFIIGLKGFAGAIIGGLASYPLAAIGAVVLGLAEAFSTFWASSYKEVIVFTLLLPVLLWRSLAHKRVGDGE
ncbi:branched-chain amino acid transport system permease protein [Agrobacterium larrymoorei]|uniref:Branched-chain amino acid transport system permease protein n=1 Tax=Agrobacterium larrymoorei TaxID=160699 RepID=A0AAJ2EQD0_9HYPH|nr:branched-chain amino acid ABC transporter permease [Agrobacterium larrymoorei]MDR6100931.1 branched-chain amino acid transport system permease protein [Agrobacterium larrymoorei]